MNIRAARKIRETSGPTVLAVDDIADTELVSRSSGLLVGVSRNVLADPIFGTIAIGSTLNRWYPMAGWTADVLSSGGSGAADKLRALPIVIGIGHTIEQVAINVTVAIGGSNVRLGIYADDGTGYPGALVADFGSVSSATTGVKTITGLSYQIQNDKRYWMAIWQSGAAQSRGVTPAALFPCNGTDSALGTTMAVGWEASLAYTTFPSTYPASAAVLASASGAFPVYFARFSS